MGPIIFLRAPDRFFCAVLFALWKRTVLRSFFPPRFLHALPIPRLRSLTLSSQPCFSFALNSFPAFPIADTVYTFFPLHSSFFNHTYIPLSSLPFFLLSAPTLPYACYLPPSRTIWQYDPFSKAFTLLASPCFPFSHFSRLCLSSSLFLLTFSLFSRSRFQFLPPF